MIDKITNCDWPDTITIANGFDDKEVPEPSRRNLEFLADKFNSLLEFVYANEPLCPCGSNKTYQDCCGEE